jgi:hypothetical protein
LTQLINPLDPPSQEPPRHHHPHRALLGHSADDMNSEKLARLLTEEARLT